MTYYSMDQAVTAGWAWLEKHAPGWQERVDTDVLDMSTGERCILGQVFEEEAEKTFEDNGFQVALIRFGLSLVDQENLGFTPRGRWYDREVAYEELALNWANRLDSIAL